MKILYVTTVSMTMCFFPEHIKMLIAQGHSVHFATNCDDPVPDIYKTIDCKIHHIPFSRSPFDKTNLDAYRDLKKLVEMEHYDIVHTHTPNASMIVRLACRNARKQGTKVVYTAHGFHFYKGAPLKNWLMYYPVEKFCAKYTDVLITINTEDFDLAKKKFHVRDTFYVPGVGIDLSKIDKVNPDHIAIRKAMNVPEKCVLLLSVGELNVNKNHEVVVRALAKLNNPNVHYAIAGLGDKKEYLEQLATKLGIKNQFHLLGYRTDAFSLYKTADVFVFPSFREGLSVSLMEAMASGMPIVCTKIRGNVDLVEEGKGGQLFMPRDVDTLCSHLKVLVDDEKVRQKYGAYNRVAVEKFGIKNVLEKMKEIYAIVC